MFLDKNILVREHEICEGDDKNLRLLLRKFQTFLATLIHRIYGPGVYACHTFPSILVNLNQIFWNLHSDETLSGSRNYHLICQQIQFRYNISRHCNTISTSFSTPLDQVS
ncbi:unnamed protein product [Hermetia illucens]|uniref:Uncharacterized protein n=1 Tax=Hermetia illucens TaxID=343691 RepID=A0A7R8YQ57_HERIL|nr:uncharacterized protein LOC119648424 [Hermetia illucens]CAD7081333.1 unnamed protein product [Hermetia illucens]